MSEQPAASINCGWTRAGLPIGLQIAGKRHDDLGVLQVAAAWEAMRPAPRPWPEPPAAATVSGLARRARQRDQHRLARRARGERERALADAVVLRHAPRRPRSGDRRRPGMAAAAGDEGGLPPQPHRAFARRRGHRHARRRRAARRRRERARARATSRPAPGRARRLAGRRRRLGRPAAEPSRAMSWPCSGRCCSTSIAAMPRPCASASPRVLPAWSEADPLHPYVLGHHAFGLEESGRYAEAEAVGRRAAGRNGARALGDPRRRPCHGDAGAARRGRRLDGDLAAVLGRGQRLRRAPRLARGAVRARGARPRQGARSCSTST